MNKIFEELYYGRISCFEGVVPSHPDYRPVNAKITAVKGYFFTKLSAEDKGRLLALENLYSQSAGMHNESCYEYGFRLGVLLILGVFKDEL